MIEINLINQNKDKYLDLLLLADPEEKVVKDYMYKGNMFVLSKDQITCSVAIVIEVNNNTLEIKNLATYESEQRKGYATFLIYHIFEHYKNVYKNIIIGTANSSFTNITLYKSLGFKDYKTIKNFFIHNYDSPIYEDGVQAIDLVYLRKNLK